MKTSGQWSVAGDQRQGRFRAYDRHARGRAFTLLELLVVVAVLGLLLAILVPSLAGAKGRASSAKCISNLRQLGQAATSYTSDFNNSFPLALDGKNYWDLTTAVDHAGNTVKAGGILYRLPGPDAIDLRIFMCPNYVLASNPTALFTGYNYNTSYIGHGVGEAIEAPARDDQLLHAGTTALFGDGEGIAGPNRFMRAPVAPTALPPPDGGDGVGDSTRTAGTQGYRHRGKTNVAFADGHAEEWGTRVTQTAKKNVATAAGTGFLSADNSMYSVR